MEVQHVPYRILKPQYEGKVIRREEKGKVV